MIKFFYKNVIMFSAIPDRLDVISMNRQLSLIGDGLERSMAKIRILWLSVEAH